MNVKRPYVAPRLVEYGRLDQLTLGVVGGVPDIDQFGNTVGPGCEASTVVVNGQTVVRTSCSVTVVGS